MTTNPPTVEERPRRPTKAVWWGLGLAVVLGVGLRWYALGASRLVYDEAFTANVGRKPLGDLFVYLREHDLHPPLDYLLRAPSARAGASEWALRAPSALFGSAALVLFAWWMRTKGRLGVIATFVMALSAFQIFYTREARMYALLLLLGVGMLMVAERWLRNPTPGVAIGFGALVLVASLDHTTGVVYSIAWLGLAGLRRDRAAWWWRGSIVGALSMWLALWGWTLPSQMQEGTKNWIPFTTFGGVTDNLGELFSASNFASLAVTAVLVVGVTVLVRRKASELPLVIWGFIVPFSLAALLGVRFHFFVAHSLALCSVGAVLAVAAAFDAAFERSERIGIVAIAVAVPFFVVGMNLALFTDTHLENAIVVAGRHARAGDAVAAFTAHERPLIDWYVGVQDARGSRPVLIPGLAVVARQVGTEARPVRRVWVAERTMHELRVPAGFSSCAPPIEGDGYRVLCLQRD